MTKELRITFQPSGRNVFALPGTTLLEAASRAGFILSAPCGGSGKCGKCLVKVHFLHGNKAPAPHETEKLTAGDRAKGYRLACQFRVTEDAVVEIPPSSLFQHGQKILAESSTGSAAFEPSVRTAHITAVPPHAEDFASFLHNNLAVKEIPPRLTPVLSEFAGRAHADLTAVIEEGRLIDIFRSSSGRRMLGLAVDIGTTTLAGALVDLATGEDLAVETAINPQTSYGDDVITRIKKCREENDGLETLHRAVTAEINSIVNRLAKSAACDTRDVFMAVFCGNTTMQQIFCGINPRALGELPFKAAFTETQLMTASTAGIDIHPEATVMVFPQIGGFVGGDTVAGILSSRLDLQEHPAILVDVGTNGEIVLSNNGRLTAASVAAGPAFEGARIAHGMRAVDGAIEKIVKYNGDLAINVIGNAAPSGICGTGLVDAAAEMLRAGILDSTGRILGRGEIPSTTPKAIARRIIEEKDGNRFVLADAASTASGEPVCLYQKDIRELQLANAAIRAGINILIKKEGLRPSEVCCVMLAGGFGNFIRRSNALRIGMLPPVECHRINFVGNTSLFGAKRTLLSHRESRRAAELARRTDHIDLSMDPDFLEEFSSAMLFPEENEAHSCD